MTTLSPDLLLPDRVGLPDAIAYLRAAYPAPQWRAHRNYGELTAFWLQVHASLRDKGGQLQQATEAFRDGQLDAAGFQRAFVPRFNQFLQHLTGHHQIEDQAYFPKFRALDPRMAVGFDLLEHDHEIIHETLLASVGQARALLAALGDPHACDAYIDTSARLLALLGQHLADEEELVIPAMLEHGERSVS